MTRAATVLEVASTSSPGVTYRVWVAEDGPIFCDCPSHKFQKGKPAGERKPCKHMKAVSADASVLDDAVALAKSAPDLRVATRRVRRSTNPHIRIIEVQEQDTTEGAWVTVTDLRRFSNLEV